MTAEVSEIGWRPNEGISFVVKSADGNTRHSQLSVLRFVRRFRFRSAAHTRPYARRSRKLEVAWPPRISKPQMRSASGKPSRLFLSSPPAGLPLPPPSPPAIPAPPPPP